MAESKPKSAYDAYLRRHVATPNGMYKQNMENLREATNANHELFATIGQILADHTQHIEALKFEINDLRGFMNWAMHTHPTIMQEYKAVEDLTGEGGIDRVLKEWGE